MSAAIATRCNQPQPPNRGMLHVTSLMGQRLGWRRALAAVLGCVGLLMTTATSAVAQVEGLRTQPLTDRVEASPKPREKPALDYSYDDGTSENLLGLTGGGTICWLQYFQTPGESDTIGEVFVAFGSAAFPGYAPPNGTRAFVGVWNDPTNDGDPSDAVLLGSNDTVIANVDTDRLNAVRLRTQITVNRGFFIGAWTSHQPRQYVAPVDQTSGYIPRRAWVLGDKNNNFDPTNLLNNGVPPVDVAEVGMPGYFLLRAATGAGLTLQVLGPCPAEITLIATGATPSSQVAFIYGYGLGSTQLQVGACAGVFVDITNPIVLEIVEVDSGGRANTVTEVIEPRCNGIYFQAIDLDTCEVTEVGSK